jgi:hypothetical protein
VYHLAGEEEAAAATGGIGVREGWRDGGGGREEGGCVVYLIYICGWAIE